MQRECDGRQLYSSAAAVRVRVVARKPGTAASLSASRIDFIIISLSMDHSSPKYFK